MYRLTCKNEIAVKAACSSVMVPSVDRHVGAAHASPTNVVKVRVCEMLLL